jgi:ABC-type uncharacterized transport system permease subunit
MIHVGIKTREQNRAFVLYMIQLALTSLIGVPLSTLAPLFEAATSTRRYIDRVLIKAALQIICGGAIVFVTGNLIDRN